MKIYKLNIYPATITVSSFGYFKLIIVHIQLISIPTKFLFNNNEHIISALRWI